MLVYWPSLLAALIVAGAAGLVSRQATQLLSEWTGSREFYVGLCGLGIVAAVVGGARMLGASVSTANTLACVTGCLCLIGFARTTARSRRFDRITRALLARPEPDLARADAVVHWRKLGEPKPDALGEYGSETAECALALVAAGLGERAEAELTQLTPKVRLSSAERAHVGGVRALIEHWRGNFEAAERLLASEKEAAQDFISEPYVKAHAALQAALRGRSEEALAVLGSHGAHAGDRCVVRWARAHALAGCGRVDEARRLLERQRARHGNAGLVPFLHLGGPATPLAKALLDDTPREI